MSTATLPGLDKPVSRLVQGTAMVNEKNYEATGRAILDAAWEAGFTAFDTAHVYGGGGNERALGRWMRERGNREEVVVLAKGAHHNEDRRRVTPFDIASDLHDTLARLDSDYVDLYVLHRDDPSQPVGPIVEALNEGKRAGLIRGPIGGSNWTHQRIAEANAYAADRGLEGFTVSSPHYSLARMVQEPWPECVSIAGPDHADARQWYATHDVKILPWSSLSAGFFSGRLQRGGETIEANKPFAHALRCFGSDDNFDRLDRATRLAETRGRTVPQIVLAYLLGGKMDVFPLVGGVTPEEMAPNVAALDITLAPAERSYLECDTPELD